MKKKTQYFLPYYNEVKQVMNCAKSMIGQPIKSAEVIINIGFNGNEYISSTEWLLITEDGEECILPFFMTPQYPTFISMIAGTKIEKKNDRIQFIYDEKPAVLIMPTGEELTFAPGKPVRVGIVDGTTGFVGNDCSVQVTETADAVIYRIITDETTHYGQFIDGKVNSAN